MSPTLRIGGQLSTLGRPLREHETTVGASALTRLTRSGGAPPTGLARLGRWPTTTDSYNHHAVGWAHALDTPHQWTKQVASHFGGTRNGTIVHSPSGFPETGRSGSSSRGSSPG